MDTVAFMETDKPENGEEEIDEQGRNPTQQRIDRDSKEAAEDAYGKHATGGGDVVGDAKDDDQS